MLIDKTLINRWLSDKRFIVISGPRASGKSILAVKLLLNLGKESIASSEPLEIPHEKFLLENLFDYQNTTIHLTKSYNHNTSRELYELIAENWAGFLDNLKENNNKLIVEVRDPSYLHPYLQTYDAELICNLNRKQKSIHVKYLDYKNGLKDFLLLVRNYWRYYRYLPK